MSIDSRNVKAASNTLRKALATVNKAHLANFTRETVPEIELVKHVRGELEERLGKENVFKTRKGIHETYGEIKFLHQPDVDLAFRLRGFLHGVEFKLIRHTRARISFYSGLEEALAYSTYGVDFSWIVHFFRKSFPNAKTYEKWMKFVIDRSGCPSVGYITSTTQSSQMIVCPRKPFESRRDGDLDKIVYKERVKHFC